MKITVLALVMGAAGCYADWAAVAHPGYAYGGLQTTRYQSPETGMAVRGGTVGNPSPQIVAAASSHAVSVTAEADAEYRRAEAEHIVPAEADVVRSQATMNAARARYIEARAACVERDGPVRCEGYGYGFGYGYGSYPYADGQYRDTIAGMASAEQYVQQPQSGTRVQTVDPEARAAIRAQGEILREHVEDRRGRTAAGGGSR